MSTGALALVQAIEAKQRELYALRSELARHRSAIRLPLEPFALVCCTLAGTRVGFCAFEVEEVVAMAELTELPGAPPWIAGLLRVGSERIAVVDLSVQGGAARRAIEPGQFVIMSGFGGDRLGLIVDGLDGLATIEAHAVHRPSLDVPFAPHVVGVVSVAGEPTLVLSIAALDAQLPDGGAR